MLEYISKEYIFVTYTWYVIIGADGILKQPVAYFPGKDAGAFTFVLRNLRDDLRSCDSWFRAANSAWSYGTRFVIPYN